MAISDFFKRKNRQPSNEEQMSARQSAARPTPQEELAKLTANAGTQTPSAQGINTYKRTIGKEQVQKAQLTLLRYKQGKANLERRIVENEQWYKLRHWECMRKSKTQEVEPTSAYLFNCIANKHAEAMDNYPSPNILPREEGDKQEAKMLSSIIPVILESCDFEQTYSDVWDYKLKTGTGVYGVFWDKSMCNGMGDVSIRKVDLINLFWESGITDIQQSRNVFHVELMDNDVLEDLYPQLINKLGGASMDLSKYVYDDTVDTTNKSVVVDWYYKRSVNGKTVLHYCKYVNDEVLYATENDPQYAERGWYDHGMYPFVFDPLYKTEGTPTGFGYIDVGKSAQEYIDRGNQAIMKNMLANARPRYFIRNDGEVNEKEFADTTKDFIHVNGNLGQDSIIPVQSNPLNSIYVSVITSKIDELKETTGNRDVANGGTTSGVTAASAISAMMEASSRLSRQDSKAAYRAYRKIIYMVIELIRQFYDLPRQFRIVGQNGAQEFVSYSNAGIQPQAQGGVEYGVDMGFRLPMFDIEVSAQKQSPYSKMSQNELALQFFGAGFFNPELADQALACLDMMDFDRKDFVTSKIEQNGTMHQQILQLQQQMIMLAQMVDQSRGTNLAEQISAGILGQPAPAAIDGQMTQQTEDIEALGGEGGSNESSITKNARQKAAEMISPT